MNPNFPDGLRQRKKNVQASKPSAKKKKPERWLGWTAICLIAAVVSVLLFTGIFLYRTTNASRLAPKMSPIVGIETDKNLWGTYRSHTYFGLKQRSPKSPLFGLMWYEQPDQQRMPNIRHWCDQNDGLLRYGWVQADGRSFGRQNITDKNVNITVDWLNYENTWTARVTILPSRQRRFNLIFYLVAQDETRFESNINEATIYTKSKSLRLSVQKIQGKKDLFSGLLWNDPVDLTRLNDLILSNTGITEENGRIVYSFHPRQTFAEGSFAALQFYNTEKATFEITMSSKTNRALREHEFLHELTRRSQQFDTKFNSMFHVDDKSYEPAVINMGKIAISNMIGSIGYWYGYNKALDGSRIVPYGPHQLISAVPSRPFFPRGFLWDEGFHLLLIQQFDPDLAIEILVSWLNTMNEDGWMPREMILDVEAEAKVPAEFVTQYPNNANPPSMFMLADKLISNSKLNEKYENVLRQIYRRMERWYNWLLKSQKGKKEGTMRWRGRNSTTQLELNPKTLTSGLDDFPRATHPSSEEYHLDLRCWIAMCSKVMAKFAAIYDPPSSTRFIEESRRFSDYTELKKLHWDDGAKAFSDYGLHSKDVKLIKEENMKTPGQFIVKRKVYMKPKYRFVDDSFGYNSLYPLIFHLIPANAPELDHILRRIKDPEELWTNYGLRSLSKKSPYYAARNTEHDPPYWRGYIWVNLNYLILSALQHYATISGPFQHLCQQLSADLRQNIINNMATQFNRTGYLWENYDDGTGEGHGSHPFNGWSSLILLIMDNAPKI